MHDNITITKTIAVPERLAWTAIRGIGGLDRWFPIIRLCRVEGDGVGALRIMALAEGGEMIDRIDALDDDRQCLRYTRIAMPFPLTDYHGSVKVREDGPEQAIIEWSLSFTVAEADRLTMNGLVAGAISNGLCGLERDLRGSHEKF